MSMENIRDLYLEDETFEDARQKFNTVLQRLFRSMIDTESNEGSRYFQHRQEIPDHIRRPSVVGNRRWKDKERSRSALSADENAGDHRFARSGVNSPGWVPPLPVGYE